MCKTIRRQYGQRVKFTRLAIRVVDRMDPLWRAAVESKSSMTQGNSPTVFGACCNGPTQSKKQWRKKLFISRQTSRSRGAKKSLIVSQEGDGATKNHGEKHAVGLPTDWLTRNDSASGGMLGKDRELPEEVQWAKAGNFGSM